MIGMAERLMDLAEARIRDRGYAGFSFRDLAVEVGLKSASVHHHFPTKAKLAAAVAQRYSKRFLSAVEAKPGESPEDAILAYRSAVRQTLEADGRMCLCGILGAEAGALAPEVTAEVQSFFRRCIEDLAGRIGGEDSIARAHHVIAALEGGMILARVYGDINAFDYATSGFDRPTSEPTT